MAAKKPAPQRARQKKASATGKRSVRRTGLLAHLDGDAFQDFMEDLLNDELRVAASGRPGRGSLHANRGDGGIDFLVEDQVTTSWFSGPAIFQFKRTQKELSNTLAEITRSDAVTARLKKGDAYYLVSAVNLPPAEALNR